MLFQHQVFRLLQTGISGYDIFGYFAGTEEDGVVAYQVARPVQLADVNSGKNRFVIAYLIKLFQENGAITSRFHSNVVSFLGE